MFTMSYRSASRGSRGSTEKNQRKGLWPAHPHTRPSSWKCCLPALSNSMSQQRNPSHGRGSQCQRTGSSSFSIQCFWTRPQIRASHWRDSPFAFHPQPKQHDSSVLSENNANAHVYERQAVVDSRHINFLFRKKEKNNQQTTSSAFCFSYCLEFTKMVPDQPWLEEEKWGRIRVITVNSIQPNQQQLEGFLDASQPTCKFPQSTFC